MQGLVTLAVALVGALGSIAAAYVARRAERNTKPVSNGFATDTTRRLDRIEALIIEHIAAHADADVHRKK